MAHDTLWRMRYGCRMRIIQFLALVFLTSNFFPAHVHGEQLPEVVRSPLGEVIKLTGQKDFKGALDILQRATREAQELTPVESLIFNQLIILQLLNLENYTEAQSMTLKLIENSEDQFVAYGFFTFGQRVAAQSVLERLYEVGEYQQVDAFADILLNKAPQWQTRMDHTMAGYWTVLGDSQWQLGKSEAALESWTRAVACWQSKKELWRQEEPERFAQFQGLDRYNPLQVAIEAKLLSLHLKNGERNKVEAIRLNWQKQYQVLFEAHEGAKGEMAAKIFYRSVESSLRAAESFLQHSGLVAQGMITKNEACAEVLRPKDSRNKE